MNSRFSNNTETGCQCGCGDPTPIPPKYGFTVEFLNQVNFEDLTSDQCTRILKILLEEKA